MSEGHDGRGERGSPTPIDPRTRIENLMTQSNTISIVVGRKVAYTFTFQIHADFLNSRIKWGCSQCIKCADGTIRCDFADEDTFRYFIEFCYTGKLEKKVPADKPRKDAKPTIVLSSELLMELWLLGQKLGALTFQDECLRTWNLKIFSEYKQGQPRSDISDVKYVWADRSTKSSVLRKFLIDSYACMDINLLFSQERLGWPSNFALRVSRANFRKWRSQKFDDSREFWRNRDLTAFKAKALKNAGSFVVEEDSDVEIIMSSSIAGSVPPPARVTPRPALASETPQEPQSAPKRSDLALAQRRRSPSSLFVGESRRPTPAYGVTDGHGPLHRIVRTLSPGWLDELTRNANSRTNT